MDMYRCNDCFMSFASPDMLRKHRTKFCVGGSLGDPHQLMLRRGLRSAGENKPEPAPPSHSRAHSDSGYIDGKVRELEDLKIRRSKIRHNKDLEERALLQNRVKENGHRQKKRDLGNSRKISDIQDEYEKHRQREREIKAIIEKVEDEGVFTERQASRASTMSIYLSDEEYSPRTNKKRNVHNSQMRHLAESHNRQIAGYQSKNKHLENQREDIRRRLEALGRRQPEEPDMTAHLLQDLRQQESKNEQTLAELKRQLVELNKGKSKKKTKKDPFISLPYYGNSLVGEISAMRQAYLQNGGNDHAVLAQMNQMLHEAQLVEGQETKPRKQKESADSLTQQMLAIELENQSLQRELLFMQQKKLPRRQDDDEEDMDKELRKLENAHLRKMTQLQHEMELLKQEAMLEKFKQEIVGPDKPRINVTQHPTADVPALLQNRPNGMTLNNPSHIGPSVNGMDLSPAPYDPNAGFVVFYDFISGLEASTKSCRLVAGLYNDTAELGEPSLLPTVYTEPSQIDRYQSYNMALIGAKQPVPKCPPAQDLCIVVELQVSGDASYDPNRLVSRAWCKIDLFDDLGRVISGRWKVPLRVTPIKANIPTSSLNSVAQYGVGELYYRVVNHRDASNQSMINIIPQNCMLHQYPPQRAQQIGGMLHNTTHHYLSPQSSSPPFTPSTMSRTPSFRETLPVLPRETNPILPREKSLDGTAIGTSPTLGFRVVNVKNAEAGEGKIRLTMYYRSSGKVVQSSTSPVTCTTSAVQSNFKHAYHIFGEQEAIFNDVLVTSDMVLIARFYLRRQLNETVNSGVFDVTSIENSIVADETLVAWGVLPLTQEKRQQGPRSRDESNHKVNTGTLSVPLFLPPVPEADSIPTGKNWQPRDWTRYGRATIRVHLFYGERPSRSLTPSEASSDEEENYPENSWIPFARRIHPENGYENKGFDLYIDGARFLPDTVTVTRVAARFLNRHYVKYGEDMLTGVNLDSLIYNPLYDYRHEVRYSVPPTSTLVIKVYTVDKFTKNLALVGYGLLNIFIEAGTGKELPTTYREGIEVALNEGAHQVRLYSQGPNGIDPLHQTVLKETGIRHVPCASILVRIAPAAVDAEGEPLKQSEVPEREWISKGLLRPRPAYNDRVYYSTTCAPTKGENKLFNALINRPAVTMREAVSIITSGNRRVLKTDDTINEFIQKALTRHLDYEPPDPNLAFISRYQPRYGIKVAVDSGMNLPWSNFTHAHMCLNPPGAFYTGVPNASYDKPIFTQRLDLDSNNRSPRWRDGFHHFRARSYHPNLTVIFHLQEVSITSTSDRYKYGLVEQAWTALPVFTNGYAYCDVFQLPLFQGSPTQTILKQLSKEPYKQWMKRAISNKTIHLVDCASIFVRLCDGRRDDELTPDALQYHVIVLNTDYIPEELESGYTREIPGTPLSRLVPAGKTPQEITTSLAAKVKTLVYKLYEDGHFG